MYSVGSNVVHPCYGAGIIRQIQTKTLGETSHRYYVIRMMLGPHPMQVMVPVRRADDIGLRPVCKPSRLHKALSSCLVAPREQDIEPDYRARQGEMHELIKTGRVEDLVLIVRLLCRLNEKRRLGSADRRIWDKAKAQLAGELALGLDQSISDATEELEDRLARMVDGLKVRQILSDPPLLPKGTLTKDDAGRRRTMRAHIESEDVQEIATVVTQLAFISNTRPLDPLDQRILDKGKRILVHRLANAPDVKKSAANREIEEYLAAISEAEHERPTS